MARGPEDKGSSGRGGTSGRAAGVTLARGVSGSKWTGSSPPRELSHQRHHWPALGEGTLAETSSPSLCREVCGPTTRPHGTHTPQCTLQMWPKKNLLDVVSWGWGGRVGAPSEWSSRVLA